MHIFIDESGTFSPDSRGPISMSAVGALVIPSQHMDGFQKLFLRLRRKLPAYKGEVKGRLLLEGHVAEVVNILRKVGALYEVVAINMADHSAEELEYHRRRQAEAMFAHITPQHQPGLVADLTQFRDQLERMPIQLYVQSALLGALIYTTLDFSNTYFAFRSPQELGGYHWVIDAKERSKTTDWEKWWSTTILAALESKSFRKPFMAVEGGDYSAHERMRAGDIGEFKRQFAKDPANGDFFDLKIVMKESFRFSADAEPGLEAVDILTNAIRRSMSGNFQREGWLSIPQLMIHRPSQYICLAHLKAGYDNKEYETPYPMAYEKVLNDFRRGGRRILPGAF